VQVALLGGRERVDPPDLGDLEPEQRRRRRARRLLGRVPRALPRDQRPARGEQRRGVLGEDGERGDRPRGHDVVPAVPLGPVLGPVADDLSVAQAGRRHRPLEERALAAEALDEGDARAGQRRREDEPGEPGAGAEVGDDARLADRGELEPGQRVGDVDIDAGRGLADRRRRRRVPGDEVQHRAERPGEPLRRPVRGEDRGQAVMDVGGGHGRRVSGRSSRDRKT
jgi:hypothetical protein